MVDRTVQVLSPSATLSPTNELRGIRSSLPGATRSGWVVAHASRASSRSTLARAAASQAVRARVVA